MLEDLTVYRDLVGVASVVIGDKPSRADVGAALGPG